ncbi:MAG: hypothetical protein IKP75_03875 [Oscillospiraceae bacterium]|nr:hypothetical protein [Oscillospiraceae bacterium]
MLACGNKASKEEAKQPKKANFTDDREHYSLSPRKLVRIQAIHNVPVKLGAFAKTKQAKRKQSNIERHCGNKASKEVANQYQIPGVEVYFTQSHQKLPISRHKGNSVLLRQ